MLVTPVEWTEAQPKGVSRKIFCWRGAGSIPGDGELRTSCWGGCGGRSRAAGSGKRGFQGARGCWQAKSLTVNHALIQVKNSSRARPGQEGAAGHPTRPWWLKIGPKPAAKGGLGAAVGAWGLQSRPPAPLHLWPLSSLRVVSTASCSPLRVGDLGKPPVSSSSLDFWNNPRTGPWPIRFWGPP